MIIDYDKYDKDYCVVLIQQTAFDSKFRDSKIVDNAGAHVPVYQKKLISILLRKTFYNVWKVDQVGYIYYSVT